VLKQAFENGWIDQLFFGILGYNLNNENILLKIENKELIGSPRECVSPRILGRVIN
jgi:hypothetical protein